MILNDKTIDINFCISWANHSWTNSWVSADTKTLLEQTYGGLSEWEEHYCYLRKFFLDKRYILVDNKPLLTIYCPENIPNLEERMNYYKRRAKEDGFDGISFAFQGAGLDISNSKKADLFDFDIEYQPNYAFAFRAQNRHKLLRKTNRLVKSVLKKCFNFSYRTDKLLGFQLNDYDDVWNYILNFAPVRSNSVPGAFVDWDNTPRKGERGSVCINMTPDKFEKYLTVQIKRCKEVYHKDMIFIFAWNEWAESGYLEPDEEYGYANLKAIKSALEANCEFPV